MILRVSALFTPIFDPHLERRPKVALWRLELVSTWSKFSKDISDVHNTLGGFHGHSSISWYFHGNEIPDASN